MATGGKVEEWVHVDKRNSYRSVVFNKKATQAVLRSYEGKLQLLQEGKVDSELVGVRGTDFLPMALVADDRVVLVANERGAVAGYPLSTFQPVKPHTTAVTAATAGSLTAMASSSALGKPAGGGSVAAAAEAAAAAGPTPLPSVPQYRLAPGITRFVHLPSKGLLIVGASDGSLTICALSLVISGVLFEAEDRRPAPFYLPLPAEALTLYREKLGNMAAGLVAAKSEAEYKAMMQVSM